MKRQFLKFLLPMLLGTFVCGSSQVQQQDPAKLTPEQKQQIHGKLFHVYQRETIPDLLAKRSGDLYLEHSQPPGFTSQPVNAPAYPPYALSAFACTSDAVIVATAQSSASFLTLDQKFIYTDWNFNVEQVLKGNPRSRLSPGITASVTRLGGTLEINNRKVYARDTNFRDFKSGSKYLLFLEFVPETGAYKATAEKSFLLDGQQVGFLLPNNPHPEIEGKDTATFINDTIAAITAQNSNCRGMEKQ